jgi:hypothetical protein
MTVLNRTEINQAVTEFVPNFDDEFLDGLCEVKRELLAVHAPQWLYRSERDLLHKTVAYCVRDIRHLGRFLGKHRLRLVLTIDPLQENCHCVQRRFIVIRDELSAIFAAMKILWLYATTVLRAGEPGMSGLVELSRELLECNAKPMKRSPEYLEFILGNVGFAVHYTLAFDWR